MVQGTQLHVSLSLSITNEMNIYFISMLVGFSNKLISRHSTKDFKCDTFSV